MGWDQWSCYAQSLAGSSPGGVASYWVKYKVLYTHRGVSYSIILPSRLLSWVSYLYHSLKALPAPFIPLPLSFTSVIPRKYKPLLTAPISSVQSLSRVQLFATPWISACQASLSITNSWSSLRVTSIESVMLSSHLIHCRPLLLLPPIPPSIRVFSNESTLCMRWTKYWF